MAEKQREGGQSGFGSGPVAGEQNDPLSTEVNSVTRASKRCSPTSPSLSHGTAPPHKSPRIDPLSPTSQTSAAGGAHPQADKNQMQMENTKEPSGVSDIPTARRTSWRRATITRRTLRALPNPYQGLCRNISTSLSQQKRLEKLMEASMRLAIDRTQNSIQAVPNTSLECFHKQVKNVKKEWGCLAKSIRGEPEGPLPACEASSCDPAVQKAMKKVQKTIDRLQTESKSWEALLNKHRSKAEELERKMEQSQGGGVSLDATCVAQSSQYLFIQSKPDYHNLLCRQQPKLQTIEMIMDTQCKMVRELLSVKEQSQLVVRETSSRLAAEAGFQDLSPDPVRNLIAGPLSSATT